MCRIRTRPGAWWRRAASRLLAALLALSAPAWAQIAPDPIRLETLPGWDRDDVTQVLPALARSCAAWGLMPADSNLGGPERPGQLVADWDDACDALAALPAAPRSARRLHAWRERVRLTLATYFQAFDHGAGTLTGYYEPLLRGSLERTPLHPVPLHALPPQTVARPPRAAIAEGALDGRGLELVWVDDAVDAFFLHIQGSGRVVLEDGRLLRLGYAGQNGHPYRAIGRLLIERGAIAREAMSMQAIQTWLRRAEPGEATAVMHHNTSYVFFRMLEGLSPQDGPPGAMGVSLTPLRSIAVDRAHVPLGAPVFLASALPGNLPGDAPMPRLVVAQDVGGAIRGPARADLFWGWEAEAGARAGRLNQPTRMFVLLPRRNPPRP